MTIEIRNAALEARLRKQLESTGSGNIEEALTHLLDTQEQQDRWLRVSRETVNAKIAAGIAQLERGEGIGEEELAAYLAARKQRLA